MDLLGILAAFGGGVVGAGVSGLISFVFVGLFGFFGIVALLTGGASMGFWNGNITFGALQSPAIGFAGGVAAAAYAKAKGKLQAGNDIVTPIYKTGSADALLLAGVFGVLGYVLVWLLGQIGVAPWTDGVAVVVFLSAAIVRLVWGKTGLTGKVPAGTDRFGAFKSNAFLKIIVGAGFGLFSAAAYNFIGGDNGGAVFGFCFSAFSLLFLELGVGVPVTHQITLPAAVAASLAGGSLVWGAIFGILGAFLVDFFAGLFNAFGDTHIDPPACTIATLTTLAIIMGKIGLLFNLP